jgi:hypothetical protein
MSQTLTSIIGACLLACLPFDWLLAPIKRHSLNDAFVQFRLLQ